VGLLATTAEVAMAVTVSDQHLQTGSRSPPGPTRPTTLRAARSYPANRPGLRYAKKDEPSAALAADITGDGARISEELVFSCAVDDVDEIHVRYSSTATTWGNKARTLTAARCMTSLTA
jgi:hypothetical protein